MSPARVVQCLRKLGARPGDFDFVLADETGATLPEVQAVEFAQTFAFFVGTFALHGDRLADWATKSFCK